MRCNIMQISNRTQNYSNISNLIVKVPIYNILLSCVYMHMIADRFDTLIDSLIMSVNNDVTGLLWGHKKLLHA